MDEDKKTLWVGNLDEKVSEDIVYELFLQTGPIDKLILPTEGEKEEEKHKGHAYVVFKHPESVQYAMQVLEGSSLFSHTLSLKARSLPVQYKKAAPHPTASTMAGRGGRFDRFDNSSLRGGFSFNKSNTWHGQNNSFTPRSRGGNYSRGGRAGQSQNYYNSGYSNNYQNQYQSNNSSSGSTGSDGSSMEDKRQRLLQQQNISLDAHRQSQQGNMYNSGQQMYNTQQQQQQQQQQWTGYSTGTDNWGNQQGYQSYSNAYSGSWYQPQ